MKRITTLLAAMMLVLALGAGVALAATKIGDNGPNRLAGTADNDTLRGLGGNDKLFGRGDSDHLFGGRGRDLLNGGSDGDRMVGGGGKDRLFGKGGGDRMFGGAARDILVGSNDGDLMVGGGGNDVINAGEPGRLDGDRIDCGPGRDRVINADPTEDIIRANCEVVGR